MGKNLLNADGTIKLIGMDQGIETMVRDLVRREPSMMEPTFTTFEMYDVHPNVLDNVIDLSATQTVMDYAGRLAGRLSRLGQRANWGYLGGKGTDAFSFPYREPDHIFAVSPWMLRDVVDAADALASYGSMQIGKDQPDLRVYLHTSKGDEELRGWNYFQQDLSEIRRQITGRRNKDVLECTRLNLLGQQMVAEERREHLREALRGGTYDLAIDLRR